MRRIILAVCLLSACVNAPRLASAITIATVSVGNAGNAPDSTVMFDGTSGYGSVPYEYRIGATEVTNAQYAAFLNAKAASDPLGLYSTAMSNGISRSGSNGSYSYAATGNRINKPVQFVNWFDAIRFANWLHNGQGTGDTETGAYALLGGTATPTNWASITRNPSATWFLPTEDEWYKAAYHKNDGVTGNYWPYSTGTDVAPVAELPPGGDNSANYGGNSVVGGVTDTGAYIGSESPYGTFDQGGNLWEWNESVVDDSSRGVRGGSFSSLASLRISSALRLPTPASTEDSILGFRVATLAVVPEPSSLALAIAAILALASVARRLTSG